MQTIECSREVLFLIATDSRVSLRGRVRLASLVQNATCIDAALVREALEVDDATLRAWSRWREIPALRKRVESLAGTVVSAADVSYPERLRQIAAPPLLLHCSGDTTLLSAKSVAIVGSRRATAYGANVARRFASRLARAGLVVVSGFARGIDAIAHATALEEEGGTIAVLGTGVDVEYPAGQSKLRREISSRGLLVSEFDYGTPPRPPNFPIRNRLIAGLVQGVVVVEAGLRSGSLVTARLALESNREVWAIPGSVLSESSAGCHALIQQGARLVTSPREILDDLGVPAESTPSQDAEPAGLSADATSLWNHLSPDQAKHVDIVSRDLGWTPPRLAGAVLELELAGALLREPGGGVLRYVR